MNTTITVNAGDDGINASNTMLIDGTTIDVKRVKKVLKPLDLSSRWNDYGEIFWRWIECERLALEIIW